MWYEYSRALGELTKQVEREEKKICD
jgi:hypothetical protein